MGEESHSMDEMGNEEKEKRKRKLDALLDPESDDEGGRQLFAFPEKDLIRELVVEVRKEARKHRVDERIAAEYLGNHVAHYLGDPEQYPMSLQVLQWRWREALLLAGRTSPYLICNQTLTVFKSVKLTSPALTAWDGTVQSALRLRYPDEFVSEAGQQLQAQAICDIIHEDDQLERVRLIEFLVESAGWSCAVTKRREAPPLHVAIVATSIPLEEKMEIIQYLLDAGADPDQEYKEYTARELFDEHVAPRRADKKTLLQVMLTGVEIPWSVSGDVQA